MLKSDLNWLPTSLFKGITYPEVIYEEDVEQGYGGYYEHGSEELVIVKIENQFISTIAHEFCHYLQYMSGKLIASPLNWDLPYEDMIKNYFRTNIYEFKALCFEYKYAKSDLNEWWLKKLVLNK